MGAFQFCATFWMMLSAFGAAAALGGADTTVQTFDSAVKAVGDTLQAPASCSDRSTCTVDQVIGLAQSSGSCMYSNLKCSDLFSSQPPSCLEPTDGTHPALCNGRWLPVCSFSALHFIRGDAGKPMSDADAFKASCKHMSQSLEACTTEPPKEVAPAPVAAAAPAAAPKPEPLVKVRLLDATERAKLEAQYRKLRSQTISECCHFSGSESALECQELMEKVEPSWCPVPCEAKNGILFKAGYGVSECDKSLTQSEFGDLDCVDPGTSFSEGDGAMGQVAEVIGKAKNVGEAAKNFKYTAAHIQLSPVVRGTGKSAFGYADTGGMLHELGHACSWIRNEVRLKMQVDEDVFNGLRAHLSGAPDDPARCALTPAIERMYAKNFKMSGASQETSTCMAELAKNGRNKQFTNTPSCTKVCPFELIDEGVGEFNRFKLMDTDKIVQSVLYRSCTTAMKDDHHPWAGDILGCILKTPSALKRVKEASKCRE